MKWSLANQLLLPHPPWALPPISTISSFFIIIFQNIHPYYPPSPFLYHPVRNAVTDTKANMESKQELDRIFFLTEATTCHKSGQAVSQLRPTYLQATAVIKFTEMCTPSMHSAQKNFCTASQFLFVFAYQLVRSCSLSNIFNSVVKTLRFIFSLWLSYLALQLCNHWHLYSVGKGLFIQQPHVFNYPY